MAERDFNVRHPDYRQNEHRWRMAWDFYRGGRNVLQPRRGVMKLLGGRDYGMEVISDVVDGDGATAGKSEQMATVSAMPGYSPSPQDSYLHKHPRESSTEFASRANTAIHLPLFRSIVDIYADAVMRVGPMRRDEQITDNIWREYHANVDRCGTPIDAFIRRVVVMGLVMGRCQVATDRPRYDTPSRSMADQIDRGDRPYSYPIKSTDFVDWKLDSLGRLAWGTVREDLPQSRAPGMPVPERRNQYRVWKTDKWEVWRSTGESDGWTVADGDRHNMGEVPVAIFDGGRREGNRRLTCDSLLADLVDIDRSLLNQASLLLEQLYSQVYAQLCYPIGMGETLPDGLEMGPRRVLGFVGEHGQPVYLQVDPRVLDSQWQLIRQTIDVGRQLANVSRGRAEVSKEERSGKTIQLESADKHSAVSALAERVEEFDHALHRHVAGWRGLSDYPRAEYDRTVSLKSLAEQINDVVALKEMQLKRAALEALTRPVFTRALREFGVQAKEIEELGEDLLDQVSETVPLPAPAKDIAKEMAEQ